MPYAHNMHAFNKIKGKTLCCVVYFYCTTFADNFGDEGFLLASDLGPKLTLGVIKTFNENRNFRMPIKNIRRANSGEV